MNKDFENAYTPFLEEYKDIFGYKPYIHDYRCSQDEFFVALIKAIATKKNIAHFVEHKHAANVPCSCGGITVIEPKTMISDVGWGKSYFVRYVKCLDCGKQGKGFNDIDNSNPVQLAVEDWMQNYEELNEPSEFIINNGQVKRIKDSFEFLLNYINPEKSDKIEEIRDSINSIYAVLNEIKSFNYPEIADNLENEVFKEVLGDCYGYDASGLSDDDIKTFRDDVANILSNDDSYNEAYNDAVHSVAERLNLKRLDDDYE